MKTKFWIEEKSLKQFFTEFTKTQNTNATLWDIFTSYKPRYIEDEYYEEYFDYSMLGLAYSNTFFDDKDAGSLTYEERERFALNKFEQYKNEISELLNQNSDEKLQPKLDYKKLDSNKELEDDYWNLIELNPFMHEFEGNFAVWKNEDKVLFLSVTKEDKELPYEIHLGGLTFDKYIELLEIFNNITA